MGIIDGYNQILMRYKFLGSYAITSISSNSKFRQAINHLQLMPKHTPLQLAKVKDLYIMIGLSTHKRQLKWSNDMRLD